MGIENWFTKFFKVRRGGAPDVSTVKRTPGGEVRREDSAAPARRRWKLYKSAGLRRWGIWARCMRKVGYLAGITGAGRFPRLVNIRKVPRPHGYVRAVKGRAV